MQQTAVTRILLVIDRAVTRAGYQLLFERNPEFEIVGDAGNAKNALARVAALKPDVVVLDTHPRVFDAVEAVRHMTGEGKETKKGSGAGRSSLPVLVVVDQLDERAHQLLRAGARGLLLGQAKPAEIIAAVRLVAAGYTLAHPLAAKGPTGPAGDAPAGTVELGEFCLAHLTRREADVLRLIARGLSNAEISAELFVSESTVKSHVQRMLDKLELRNRVHAVIYAYEAGLV